MTQITYHIDPADLEAWELAQIAILAPLNLTMTPSFIAENYLSHKLGQWFDDNTADGWEEMRGGWMTVTYCAFDTTPLSANLEFHSKSEAMLFKLTFGGAA